jgi:hypothetical protein
LTVARDELVSPLTIESNWRFLPVAKPCHWIIRTETSVNNLQHEPSGTYASEHRLRFDSGGIASLAEEGGNPAEMLMNVVALNEGHSAFAVLEAIRSRMEDEGLSFDEAAPRCLGK